MRGFARSVLLVAAVAALLAVADPSSRPTIGRVAVWAVAVAASISLATAVSGRLPSHAPSAFTPGHAAPAGPPVPVALQRLVTSFDALPAGDRIDGNLRAQLHEVAASRLRRHGLALDDPADAAAVRALLGDPLADALRDRTAPADPEQLVRPLEAL